MKYHTFAKIIQDGLRKYCLHILDITPIQHGTQIRLLKGAVINIYRTPKILVQGKFVFESPEKLREWLEYVLPSRITVWNISSRLLNSRAVSSMLLWGEVFVL